MAGMMIRSNHGCRRRRAKASAKVSAGFEDQAARRGKRARRSALLMHLLVHMRGERWRARAATGGVRGTAGSDHWRCVCLPRLLGDKAISTGRAQMRPANGMSASTTALSQRRLRLVGFGMSARRLGSCKRPAGPMRGPRRRSRGWPASKIPRPEGRWVAPPRRAGARARQAGPGGAVEHAMEGSTSGARISLGVQPVGHNPQSHCQHDAGRRGGRSGTGLAGGLPGTARAR